MSAHRAKAIGVAATGTLAVAAAISATAVTLSSAAVAAPASTASTADAYLMAVTSHQNVATALQTDTLSAAQLVVQFDHVSLGLQHEVNLVVTRTTEAKAAEAKAAATKAAATKAATARPAEPGRTKSPKAGTNPQRYGHR